MHISLYSKWIWLNICKHIHSLMFVFIIYLLYLFIIHFLLILLLLLLLLLLLVWLLFLCHKRDSLVRKERILHHYQWLTFSPKNASTTTIDQIKTHDEEKKCRVRSVYRKTIRVIFYPLDVTISSGFKYCSYLIFAKSLFILCVLLLFTI
jgi:hypothetical protein